jgi:hypothetical protein
MTATISKSTVDNLFNRQNNNMKSFGRQQQQQPQQPNMTTNHKNYHQQQQDLNMGRLNYNLGDLVWAKLMNHPWWPCKIVKDTGDANQRFFKLDGNYIGFSFSISVFDTFSFGSNLN